MYFKLFKPKNWRKRSVEARRRNCAVLPKMTIRHSMEEEAGRMGGPCGAALFSGEMLKALLQLGECSACPCKGAAGRSDLAAVLERLAGGLQ